MRPITSSEPQPAARAGTEEHRRAARMRKVRPVAFVPRSADAEPALQTVTANVSRGGMLLVTRQDQFPPAGAAVLLMPFEVSTGASLGSDTAIQGRIVYTRFSPRARLRFAGLKFEQDLSERAARMLGLDGAPDAVTDAVTTLEELEANAARIAVPMEAVPSPGLRVAEVEYPRARPVETERVPSTDFAAAQRAFVLATAAFLGEWGEERIRRSVSERHALARAKGSGGLRAMKLEWMELRGRFGDLSASAMDLAGMAARGPGADPFFNAERDQPRAEIMQALRSLAGHVGRILVRHGFDDVGPESDWAPVPSERGAVTFVGAMAYAEDMRQALQRASAARAEMVRSQEQSETAREQMARSDALDLWDRA